MPFSLPLPPKLANAGWKVKIHDNERCEDPHLTIWFKLKGKWRIQLRDGKIMDGGSWKDIHAEVRAIVTENWEALRIAWDEMYGDVNPIGEDDEDA